MMSTCWRLGSWTVPAGNVRLTRLQDFAGNDVAARQRIHVDVIDPGAPGSDIEGVDVPTGPFDYSQPYLGPHLYDGFG
jgi:hypothetical protein